LQRIAFNGYLKKQLKQGTSKTLSSRCMGDWAIHFVTVTWLTWSLNFSNILAEMSLLEKAGSSWVDKNTAKSITFRLCFIFFWKSVLFLKLRRQLLQLYLCAPFGACPFLTLRALQ